MNDLYLFRTSAIVEMLTGLGLLAAPLFLIRLLLDDRISQTAGTAAVGYLLGVSLLALGIAGWEGRGREYALAPRVGLCAYNLGVGIVLVLLGTIGGMNGILLWPTALLHAVFGMLMLWLLCRSIGEGQQRG